MSANVIMAKTGHKSLRSVARYVRPGLAAGTPDSRTARPTSRSWQPPRSPPTVFPALEGDSPIAAARVRIEIPSARAETSAHVRSRPAWSSRHAARETRASTRRSRRPAAIRSLVVTRPACQPRSGNWTP